MKIIEDENKEFSNIINKKYFLYGNIKPDGIFQSTPSQHKREEALPYILEKIEKLKNCNLRTQEDIDKFSVALGIVCHFLSDFYCMPHVQRWGDYKGLKRILKGIEHIYYEFKISFHKNEIRQVVSSECYNVESPVRFIEESFKRYEEDMNLSKDVYYATVVCNSIVSYIVKNQILKTKKSI